MQFVYTAYNNNCRGTTMIKKDKLYSGKAKTVYKTDEPNRYIVEFRDSLTAFDGEKHSEMKGKGYYNAQISAVLYPMLESHGISTHFIEMLSDDEMVVEAVEIILLEVIVRNIAAGSITKKYPIAENTEFDPAIIAFDYKCDEKHDPMINEAIAKAAGLSTDEEMDEIKRMAKLVNKYLIEYMLERELILVDFKLEFGRTTDGRIVLADEISCDTCRLWDAKTRQSLDKDVFRFDKGDLLDAYREVARRIVGESIE